MTTPEMTLLIGPRNRSTWSLRAWLLLSHYGIAFTEDHVDYNTPEGKERLKATSPSGWVPVLWHKGEPVWDTLAIAEYLNETFPEYAMWPEDARARAVARSITAEMHSGFAHIRNEMTMYFAETREGFAPSEDCSRDIERVQIIFGAMRQEFGQKFGKDGPFLFGKFSIADAFFAPVVSRFRTYGIECEGEAAKYCATMWSLPSMQQWYRSAQAEVLEAEA